MRLVALVALAATARGIVALQTLVPARDADAYLWMAERIAAGRIDDAFATVFHPLYSFLVAAVVAVVGGSTVAAGQLVACTAGALAAVPLHAAARRAFDTRAADFATLCYAVGVWFARHPADCLSEGPFFLVVALAAWVSTRPHHSWRSGLVLGALAGVAFGLRPEGLTIALLGVPWLLLRRERVAAAATAGAAIATSAPWPIGWSLRAGSTVLTPKAAFNYEQGVGGDGAGFAHYLEHALAVPLVAFEAIGYVAFPLAIYGVWRTCRPVRLGDPRTLWLTWFVLQCLVVPALRSNVRFLAGYGMLLLPFAGAGAIALMRSRGKAAWFALLALTIGPDLARLPQTRRADRVVLIELGHYLRPRLGADARLVTEMPRLAYFAGQPPPPPRPIHRAEILELAAAPDAHVVAIVAPRTHVEPADLAPLGYSTVTLPPALAELVAARRILVLARPE